MLRYAGCVLCCLAVVLLEGPAAAQDSEPPLTFSVTPSGVEAETPEERLERRLKQREFLFRSICIQCGPGDRFRSNAPFRPFDALARPPRTDQE